MLGGGGVGKSALTIRMVTDWFLDEYDPTIEDSYRKQIMVDGVSVLLDIVDTAGQEEFASMQDTWMRNGKGFLLVYSITSRPSFEEISELYEKILRVKECEHVPIVLAGNKCDLASLDRQVSWEEGQELAKSWDCPFFETSAKLKLNSESCFHELVRETWKSAPSSEKVSRKKKYCVIL